MMSSILLVWFLEVTSLNCIRKSKFDWMSAATETTAAAALTFILNMLQNLDIQREVQRELDSVIGPNRMPTMEDILQLPYLSAVIRESIR